MNGSIGHQAEKVKSFIEKLVASINIPVEYRDESLTTLEARRLMQITRKKKQREKEKDDAIAAAYLLQGYLDENQIEH
jgi:putative holliday junction resolvase